LISVYIALKYNESFLKGFILATFCFSISQSPGVRLIYSALIMYNRWNLGERGWNSFTVLLWKDRRHQFG